MFRAKITDVNGNSTDSATFSISSDNTPPHVTDILRANSANEDTNADTVKFEVSFSEDVKVSDIKPDDFVVTGPSGTTVTVKDTGRNGSDAALANKFEVTVTKLGSHEGEIKLGLAGGKGSFTNLAGNPQKTLSLQILKNT